MNTASSFLQLSLTMLIASGVALALLIHAVIASNVVSMSPSVATEARPGTLCPVNGKPVDPAITMVHEGRTRTFGDETYRISFVP